MKKHILVSLLLGACSTDSVESPEAIAEERNNDVPINGCADGADDAGNHIKICSICIDRGAYLDCTVQVCWDDGYCEWAVVQPGTWQAREVTLSGTHNDLFSWSLAEGVTSVPITDGLAASELRGARDLDGDGTRDLYFEVAGGNVAVTTQGPNGAPVGRTYVSPQHRPLAAVADLDGDLAADLLRRASNGQLLVTFGSVNTAVDPKFTLDNTWMLAGTGDFDGNRKDEIVWRKGTEVRIWNMNGATLVKSSSQAINAAWTFGAIGDFDGDGKADILWRDTANSARIWKGGLAAQSTPSFALSSTYAIEGAQDVNNNGRAELLLRKTGMTGVQYQSLGTPYVEGGVVHGPEYTAH